MHINILNVGTQGRADWVANGVLYVPIGFLTVILLAREKKPFGLAVIGSLLFSYALAVTIEFAQLSFPPRTVSLNDLIAEFIGSTLGAALAIRGAQRFRSFYSTLTGKPERLAAHLLKAYAIAYLAFSLFPYDFVVSWSEINWKLNSENWGWLIAHEAWTSSTSRWAKLFAEMLATVPLGWMLRQQTKHRQWQISVLITGIILGLLIEIAQFFVVSGVAQGISILTRTLGMLVGALIWQRREALHFSSLASAIRRHMLLTTTLYLIVIAAINGWFDHGWTGWESASYTLSQVRFLPFYYHYYTTEQAALLSLSAVCLMYAPIGILTWASWFSATWAMILAMLAAAIMEASKLFLQDQHPDPTNLFLAAFAAWATATLLQRLATMPAKTHDSVEPRVVLEETESVQRHTLAEVKVPSIGIDQTLPSPGSLASLSTHRLPIWTYGLLILGVIGLGWGIITYPLHAGLLGLFLGGYAVLLWYRPELLFLAIPAALPILDFSPWSGRFFFDEFDLLLIVSLIVGYIRLPFTSRPSIRDPLFAIAITALGLSYAIGMIRGFLPWQIPDLNSVNNYYSSYNSLRIAKGALWAFLIYGLLRRTTDGLDVQRLFAWGMAAGLAVTVTVVVWERITFPGLFNFTDVYRVTGPFSQMHIGGADLETYLTLSAPFVVLLIFLYRHWAIRLAGAGLLLSATYAMMVTFSRIGYAAYATALLLALLASLVGRDQRTFTSSIKRSTSALVLAALSLAVAWPIFTAPFAQERMSQVGTDLATRQAHWVDALNMRDPGLFTTIFGMGLGRYPETHFWRSEETHAATYSLGHEAGNIFLRLGSGSPLYMEQFVTIQSQQNFTLSLRVRSNQQGQLNVSLCEKWLLTSAHCNFQVVNVTGDGRWQTVQAVIESGEMDSSARRPVKFSIWNANAPAIIDVDELRLHGLDGRERLLNGNFARGTDLWFFSVDNDRPWHIWSLPVALIFDLGWLGLLAFSFFVLIGLGRATREAWRGDLISGAALASCVGFLVIGSMGSLVDSPRLLLLILLLVWMGARGRTQNNLHAGTARLKRKCQLGV